MTETKTKPVTNQHPQQLSIVCFSNFTLFLKTIKASKREKRNRLSNCNIIVPIIFVDSQFCNSYQNSTIYNYVLLEQIPSTYNDAEMHSHNATK